MNNYKKVILSNKVPLYTIPIKGAKTTTALVLFRTGSKYETKDNSGISHFLEHLFFKGTKRRPNTLALSSEMDSLGGEYNAFTSKEFTGYWFKVANNKLAKALDIMGDMMFESLFDAAEIEREKGVIIEELNMYEDNPRMHIDDVFEACLYGETAAGRETIGTKKNILSFKREELMSYFQTQYGTKSVQIVIAGAIKPNDKKTVEKIFNRFTVNKYIDKTAVKENQKTPQLLISPKKIDQSVLSLGVRTYAIDSPEEFKLKLIAIILGGSMSSRLFINLRERNGLAYYVHTDTEFYSDSGYLTTESGVPKGKIKEAMKIILAEYKKISREIVPASELKRAQDILAGRVLLQMESSDNLARWYAREAMYRRKIMTPGDLIKIIKKITPTEIRESARKIFIDKNLNFALIGQASEDQIKPLLKL